jgi:hypothetical protein
MVAAVVAVVQQSALTQHSRTAALAAQAKPRPSQARHRAAHMLRVRLHSLAAAVVVVMQAREALPVAVAAARVELAWLAQMAQQTPAAAVVALVALALTSAATVVQD